MRYASCLDEGWINFLDIFCSISRKTSVIKTEEKEKPAKAPKKDGKPGKPDDEPTGEEEEDEEE